MDSGVFESISKNCNKFDDTILKVYRFKQPKEENVSPQKSSLPEENKEKLAQLEIKTAESSKKATEKYLAFLNDLNLM